MKILFVQDNGINESLALMELSSYLIANNHQTCLLIEKEEKYFEKEIRKFNPDIFLIPCPVLSVRWALNLARTLKTILNKKIIFAGAYPTVFPEVIHDGNVDIVCVGETEKAILNLLNCLQRGQDIRKIDNLIVKENGNIYTNPVGELIKNLDELPLPDRGLYYHRYKFLGNFKLKRFLSGRGCIHNCSYCFNSSIKKIYSKWSFVRKKSVKRIIDEIQNIRLFYPIENIHFSDDIFLVDNEWIDEFSVIYKKQVGLSFTCNASVDLINKKTVRALCYAGCSGIAIGIETGNENLRTKIMNKQISNQMIRTAASLIKESGIKLVTFNIIGNPEESISNAFETIRLNQDIRSDCPRVALPVFIPKTKYADWAIEKGFLLERNNASFPIIFDLQHRKQWLNLYYLFPLLVKFPSLTYIGQEILSFPFPQFLKFLYGLNLLNEKRIFNIKWLDGLRYLSHVKNPELRTNVYPSLI